MLVDKLHKWAGVWLLTLLGVAPLRAQAPATLPPNPQPAAMPAARLPAAGLPDATPVAMPIDAPNFHPVCMTPPEPEERGWLSGLFVDGEYLLLQPHRNALDYAIVSPNTTQIPSGVVDSLDYETRSAFSFGVGYELPNSGWSLAVHYTYLHSADGESVSAPAGGAVYATLPRAGTFDQVTSASAATSLNYNVIDVEASKHTVLSDALALNLSGGVRVAWIDQTFGAIYNGGPSGANNAMVDAPVYFSGAGLTMAAEAEWKVYRGFGFFGMARGSLLSGQFRNFFTESNNGGSTSIVDVSETQRQLVPVLELGAGVSFQTEHVRLRVGYDMANWFNMVNSMDFSSPTDIGHLDRRTSDLMLEGLTVQAGLVFDPFV